MDCDDVGRVNHLPCSDVVGNWLYLPVLFHPKTAENFKRPKNREDGSDLNVKKMKIIEAMRSTSGKTNPRDPISKNMFSKSF